MLWSNALERDNDWSELGEDRLMDAEEGSWSDSVIQFR